MQNPLSQLVAYENRQPSLTFVLANIYCLYLKFWNILYAIFVQKDAAAVVVISYNEYLYVN